MVRRPNLLLFLLLFLLLLLFLHLLQGKLVSLLCLSAAEEQTAVVPVALEVPREAPHERRLLAGLLLVHVY